MMTDIAKEEENLAPVSEKFTYLLSLSLHLLNQTIVLSVSRTQM